VTPDLPIPEAAREAAVEAFRTHWDDSLLVETCACEQQFGTTPDLEAHIVDAIVEAALPHLRSLQVETQVRAGVLLGKAEALEEIRRQFERITYASDDGTEFEHSHPVDEGDPECPACWVQHIRQILGVNLPPKSERPLHVMSCGDCRADLDVRDHYPDCGQMYAPQAAERGSDGLTGSGEGPSHPKDSQTATGGSNG
jgi:hypothetical protein